MTIFGIALRRRNHRRRQAGDQLLQHDGCRLLGLIDERFAQRDVGHDGLAHDSLEELFLVGEVEVERALGNAGAPRDIF